MSQTKTYIGDGVYAEMTYDMVRLTTERAGGEVEIFLGPDEVNALLKFVERAYDVTIKATSNFRWGLRMNPHGMDCQCPEHVAAVPLEEEGCKFCEYCEECEECFIHGACECEIQEQVAAGGIAVGTPACKK